MATVKMDPHYLEFANSLVRLTDAEMEDLARAILSKALQDPHVRSREQAEQRVRFNDLLVALADAARELLGKGF